MKENATHIACNEPLAGDAYRLRFPVDWRSFMPGQFVMVAIPGGTVFLRRPFGIARVADGCAEVCYKVVGRGTAALARAPVGTPLDVTGPCGRGFGLPAAGQTAVLVAGGYGIGPMLGLCDALLHDGMRVELFYGAKRASELLYLPELKELGIALHLATEDGSVGAKGLVTALVERELASFTNPAIFACGPEGLVRAVARLGLVRELPAQVSMEAYMACGIGVCLGCACKDAAGNYVRTCREGPVFEAAELGWDA
jgi:dihydroorotate dehydrogenase electron transfer subunit